MCIRDRLNQANGTIETFKEVMTSRHFESAKCNTQDRFEGAHNEQADEFTSKLLANRFQGPTSRSIMDPSSSSLGVVTPPQAAQATMSRVPEPNKSVVVHPDNCLSGIRGRRDNTGAQKSGEQDP